MSSSLLEKHGMGRESLRIARRSLVDYLEGTFEVFSVAYGGLYGTASMENTFLEPL